MSTRPPEEVVVLDFETTGLSPHCERIIEVGAVRVCGSEVGDTFSALMNPGFEISSFITRFTGITNEMLVGKPAPEKVMPQLKKFVGARPIIAHNAGFDAGFFRSEMKRIHWEAPNPFLCTVLLARRLLDDCANHKLGTLAKYFNIQQRAAHRALDDALVTAKVWIQLRENLLERVGQVPVTVDDFYRLSKTAKARVHQFIEKFQQTE